ncbi:MAG: TolC family outer membrane protein [Coxiellaceae bacterium]|nr:TolC family outer membrane protein [Coxiellaceae bacterium]
MKRLGTLLLGSFLLSAAQADDLMQVYGQAVESDPIFAQAQSTWHSQKMNIPIAEAGYLPQLNLSGNWGRTYQNLSPISPGYPNYAWGYGYTLTLTQQIFNLQAWEKIKGAKANVKSATATYLAAQQSLMQRTAQAYFNVLQAYDRLRYTIADKRAVWQQFLMAREQFRVGLIAVTDEYDARSRYDKVVAQQIAAQNNLNIQLEDLRVITGHDYKSLSRLGKRLPLVTPMPNNMERWVDVATAQNYSIKAQSFAVTAAMDNIKVQAAGGYPSLGLQGTSGQVLGSYPGLGSVTQTSGTLGIALSYNPIQGGSVIASTRQARYDYVTASAALEQAHRQVVDQARTSFLSVLSFMSQVKADKESIMSSKSAFAATEAGFKVGTRTMVDVLNDLSGVYSSQQAYANDQYAYINNLIALKAAAGTLSVKDLEDINKWLGKQIVFPEKTSVGKVPTENDKRDVLITNDIDGIQTKTEQKIVPVSAKTVVKPVVSASASIPSAPASTPVPVFAPTQSITPIPAPATPQSSGLALPPPKAS